MVAAATFDPVDAGLAVLRRAEHARLAHVARLPAREARFAQYPAWVDGQLRGELTERGVARLWSHQAQAAQALHEGRHVVLTTGTASGKSLAYLLPVLTDIAAAQQSCAGRATALYLSPTKALGADQAQHIEALGLSHVRVATYDGDTPSDERRWIRRHAGLVLTNPDMLHAGMLPAHEAWASFWRGLRYVVVDECHVYRGVFGAHVAAVLRRLRRVAAYYGAAPTFALASATIAESGAHAQRLTGLPVQPITDDGSPRAAMTVAFVDPRTAAGPAADEPVSALTRAGDLLADLVGRGVQTVAFARSRLGVEVVADRATHRLESLDLGLASSVAAYRGGYLPEERRDLEARLRDGRLRGLAATSALELGIDISGLDAVVLAGWPGTRSALWQRAGRAGRSGRESLAVLIASDDPLDHFLVGHPQAVLGAGSEGCGMDPQNPYVLLPHLAAAAAEVALTPADEAYFGPQVGPLAQELVRRGLLRARRGGWYWTRQERATDLTGLRGAGSTVEIVESLSGRVLGTVDVPRADAVVHTGAVYVHQQRPYVVTDLDLVGGTALVARGDPGWRTQARSVGAFDIVGVLSSRAAGPVTVAHGHVTVRQQVTSFLRRAPDGSVLGEHPLQLPERQLPTRATWWTITPEALAAVGVAQAAVPGAAHAAEHAAIGLLPLVAQADRWDIGGVSTALHPDTGLPTVLIYDGHAGGAGIAERGFEQRQDWLRNTRAVVADCPCESGCPACVQSPKCGNGNEPLDKAASVLLLDLLLTECSGDSH
ncbi:putative ATP-dependent helicase [Kineosphaera limosa NBRC 100340]|uniref:Putative ATP-dependent helicase n=1 Tax=Kineosphaera limosa NBRC 100340 TaxID=1184609 RepID=K6WZC4_9MICO|nr:putative ATP-dependent helicase [Kineosphaera limosa NBRC 100340]